VLPTSTKHRVLSLDLEHTRTLGSSAGPIFFRFFSASFLSDFIVKAGDDIRQDELVLLIGSMMNQIWQSAGLPVKLVTYQCKVRLSVLTFIADFCFVSPSYFHR
jgi:hypothetical protein